jgi:hypothetical protein
MREPFLDLGRSLTGAAQGAIQLAVRRALLRVAPRLARHAVGHAAASSAAVLAIEISGHGLSLLRGRIDRDTFRARATGAASSAAMGLAAAAVGAAAGPLVASGFVLGASLVTAQREAPPARHEYHEAIEAHLGRFHGGIDPAG